MSSKLLPLILLALSPSGSNNLAAGFHIGQQWMNTVTGTLYKHTTDGVWVSISYDPVPVVSYVDYTPSAAPAHIEGRTYWDSSDHTLSLMTEVTGVVLQVGQENYLRVVNKTGVQINDGQCVYINGAQGNRPTPALAIATSSNADKVIGVATQNIANNAEGYITTFGIVRGFNTSAFTAGDTLYVSPTTAGALTNVKPTQPNEIVRVGYALNSTVSGSIIVCVRPGTHLEDLHDVLLTAKANNDFLVYDSAATLWKNLNGAAARTAIGLGTTDNATLAGVTAQGAPPIPNGATSMTQFGSDGGYPTLRFVHSAAAVDNRIWDMLVVGQTLGIRLINDAYNSVLNVLALTRTGISDCSTILTGSFKVSGGATPTAAIANEVKFGGGHIRSYGSIISQGTGAAVELISVSGSPSYIRIDQTANSGKIWRIGNTGAASYSSFDIYNQTDAITALSFAADGKSTFSSDIGIGVAPLTGGGSAKWITCNGTGSVGGGLITAIDGVATGYVYTYSGYVQVQSVTGLKLQTNGGDTALTFETNRLATFYGTAEPTAPNANEVRVGAGQIWSYSNITSHGNIACIPSGSIGHLILGANDSGSYGAITYNGNGSQTNWRVGSNITLAHGFEWIPSTATGGSTFATPVMTLSSAGDLSAIGIIKTTAKFSGSDTNLNLTTQNTWYNTGLGAVTGIIIVRNNTSGGVGVFAIDAVPSSTTILALTGIEVQHTGTEVQIRCTTAGNVNVKFTAIAAALS